MNPTDKELALYADGLLNDERKQQLIKASKHDAELFNILAALDASRLPFKAAGEQQRLPAVPDALIDQVRNMVADSKDADNVDLTLESKRSEWPIRIVQVACLVVCVGVGYVAGIGQSFTGTKGENSTDQIAKLNAQSSDELLSVNRQKAWVQRIVDYQSLYVPNTVKDIKVDVVASVEKLEKLKLSAGIRTAMPDFSSEGYVFVRVQELGFEGQPLVQLVYTKEGRPPLALCFMPAGGDIDRELSLELHHGMGAANWISDYQRFVLIAHESEETLKKLYRAASVPFSDS